jgi:hypothetical protein
MPTFLANAWHILTTTLPGQFFLFSIFILFIGIMLKVWDRAVQWSFLNGMLLSEIEKCHPHLPSCKVIAIIFLCNIQLLVLSMYTVSGILFLRESHFAWLYLGAVFLLSAVAWILAELKGQRAAEYGLAFNVGTTIAFFFLLLKMNLTGAGGVQIVLILTLFVMCLFLLWLVLARILLRAPRFVLLSTIAFWLLLSQLH